MKKTELPPCGLTTSVGPNWQNPDAFSVGSDEPVKLSAICRTRSDVEELEQQGIRLSLEDLSYLGQPGVHAVLRPTTPERRMLIYNRNFRGHQEIGFWAVEAETWKTVARENEGLIVVERSDDVFMIAAEGNLASLDGGPASDSVWLFDAVVFPPSALDGIVTNLFGLNQFERPVGEPPADLCCLKLDINGALSLELPGGGVGMTAGTHLARLGWESCKAPPWGRMPSLTFNRALKPGEPAVIDFGGPIEPQPFGRNTAGWSGAFLQMTRLLYGRGLRFSQRSLAPRPNFRLLVLRRRVETIESPNYSEEVRAPKPYVEVELFAIPDDHVLFKNGWIGTVRCYRQSLVSTDAFVTHCMFAASLSLSELAVVVRPEAGSEEDIALELR